MGWRERGEGEPEREGSGAWGGREAAGGEPEREEGGAWGGESRRGREESGAWGGEELRVEGWRWCVGLGIWINRDEG